MKLIPEMLRKAIAFHRKHGFWPFVKAASICLLNEYRLKRYCYSTSLRTRVIRRGRSQKRIFYIDYFSLENSNFYWLEAFRRFGRVESFDIIKDDKQLLEKRIMNFKPYHIHLGGSVKNNSVPPQLLSKVKKKLRCTVSIFYGDRPYSPYHSELAKVIDYIYVTNKTHIKINKGKGLRNFKYIPCPTDPDIFNRRECKKIYNIVFIGNNNQACRLPLLKRLAENFDLKVFGKGWEETGLNHGKPVYGREFAKVCSKAKICLGVLDSKWTELEAYFSNRLVNTLATRSFYIQRYTKGLEKIFATQRHLVWYTTENELTKLIKYYLNNEKEREKIAAQGQREVYENYTYERSVKRFMDDAHKKRTLKLHLGCESDYLDGYINIDKYNPLADRIMDAGKLDYPDSSVDEILTSHMIEHLTYPEFMKALREWRRVLKENGLLAIRCPNFEKHLSNWLNADYRRRWGERNEGVNVILGLQERGAGYLNRNIFTPRRLRTLAEMAGFAVLECHSYVTRDENIPEGDILLQATKKKWNRLDEEWQDALIGEIIKGGERFTLKWYKNHPITRELLRSNVLRGKVIDLGCGIGARAFLATRNNSRVKITGIDASQYPINYAIDNFESCNLDFLCADLLRAPFKKATFDNAYTLEVIQHIVDTNALLNEIKRVVKPKGKLFLSVTEKNYHSDPSYVHIFTKNSLKGVLKEFKVLNLCVKGHIIFATIEV